MNAQPRTQNIPEWKKKAVNDLVDLIKTKKTILLASIKDIPASQFQEIGKKLRGKAIIKVPKKNILIRALEGAQNETAKEIEKQLTADVAILFSDLDTYDLAGELLKKKTPAKAKAGQISPKDIEIEAGPTELPPGPAITELGSVGLQVQIEKGKIAIRESKIIVKEGEIIRPNVADVMSKLDIKPFSIGFTPLVAVDSQEKQLYLEININPEETKEALTYAYSRGLPFAVSIGYVNSETLPFLFSKANMHERALKQLLEKDELTKEKKEDAPKESPEEEKKDEEEDNTQDKSLEEKQ